MGIPCFTITDHEGNELSLEDFKEKFEKDEAYRSSFNKAKAEAETNIPKVTNAGVTHKALTGTAGEIGIEGPKRGEGSTPEGRESRLNELTNDLTKANQIVDDFLEDKKQSVLKGDTPKTSPEIVAASKAVLHDLYKQRNEIRDSKTLSSKEKSIAVEEINKKIQNHIDNVAKPIATASSQALAEHKGDFNLDTDSESGLQESAEMKSNKPLSDQQINDLKDKSDKSKATAEVLQSSATDLDTHITEKTKGVKSTIENPSEHFSNKDSKESGKDFTDEEVKSVWDVFKGHLDSTKSVQEAFKNTMDELHLTFKQIDEAIKPTTEEGVKSYNQLFKAEGLRRRAINNAEKYVKDINRSKFSKFFDKAWDLPQKILVTGHGFTAPVTHAILNLYDIPNIKDYAKFVKNTYRFGAGGVFSENIRTEYEKTMMEMQLDPAYKIAEKYNLAIKRNVDYSADESINKMFDVKDRFRVGERGFDMLKPYRLELWKSKYEKLTQEQRENPAILEQLARHVNTSTGTFNFKGGNAQAMNTIGKAFWSFKLQAGKAAYTFIDPIDVAANLTKSTWAELTPEQKYKNKLVLKRTGWLLGSGAASLLINQAALSASGSKDNVNFSDPDKDDWLAYKVNGKSIPLITNPMFVYKLIVATIKHHTSDTEDTPQKQDEQAFFRTVRAKLHPTLGIVWDLTTGTNAMGQVNPFTQQKEAVAKIKEDNPRQGWGEWVGEKFAPIPIAEATREIVDEMKKEGMNDDQVVGILNGFLKYGAKGIEHAAVAMTGIPFRDAKTNQRLFDNGNIPSIEDQKNVYKTGSQAEINYMDRNIKEKVTAQINDIYDKKYEEMKDSGADEKAVAREVIKNFYKKDGYNSTILKTFNIGRDELEKYLTTTLKQKTFDKQVESGKISEEAKKYSEMTDSNVNEAFALKLRNIKNIDNKEKRNSEMKKTLSLIQELQSLGKIDKEMYNKFITVYVKGNRP